MIKWGFVLVLLLSAITGFSISNTEIRDIMDKAKPTIGDAVYLISALDKEDVERNSIDLKSNSRLASLKLDDALTAGSFSIVAIELKKAKSGFFYFLTGLSKYSTDSLIYQKVFPAAYSWNREISGNELIEFVTTLKNNQK